MRKLYCYGDIHNHVESAQRFLDHEKPDKVIWLGDHLDTHDDKSDDPAAVGKWLKETMRSRPQDIFVLGNHELPYRFPETDKYKICGWTRAKHETFHQHFPRELWERFVIFHKEEWNGHQIYFSHAGLDKRFFPFEKFDHAHLERISAYALADGDKEPYNALLDNWSHGPMWMRWQNFGLLDGISQIVGHTTFECPQIRATKDRPEWNLLLDCAHTYYAVFKEKHAYAINRHKGYEHLLNFKVD